MNFAFLKAAALASALALANNPAGAQVRLIAAHLHGSASATALNS